MSIDLLELVSDVPSQRPNWGWVAAAGLTTAVVGCVLYKTAHLRRHILWKVWNHPDSVVLNRPVTTEELDDGLQAIPVGPDGAILRTGDGAIAPTRAVERATPFRRWVARLVKAKTGTPRLTAANELMVEKVVRDVLTELGVRVSHFHMHVPIISAMVMVPGHGDIEKRLYLASASTKNLLDLTLGKTWLQRAALFSPIRYDN